MRLLEDEETKTQVLIFISNLSRVLKVLSLCFAATETRRSRNTSSCMETPEPPSPPSPPSSISVSFAHSFLSNIVFGSQDHRHGSSHLRPLWDECKRRVVLAAVASGRTVLAGGSTRLKIPPKI